MQAGDTILKIDHTRIHFFRDISAYTQFHSGDAVTVTYERDGERYQTVLTAQIIQKNTAIICTAFREARKRRKVLCFPI